MGVLLFASESPTASENNILGSIDRVGVLTWMVTCWRAPKRIASCLSPLFCGRSWRVHPWSPVTGNSRFAGVFSGQPPNTCCSCAGCQWREIGRRDLQMTMNMVMVSGSQSVFFFHWQRWGCYGCHGIQEFNLRFCQYFLVQWGLDRSPRVQWNP